MYLTKYQGLGTKGIPININWSQFANSNLQIVSEKTTFSVVADSGIGRPVIRIFPPGSRRTVNLI